MSTLALKPQPRQLDRLRLRLRVMRRRIELDVALAEGADPAGDPALALRAEQLTEPSTRRGIANVLDHLVDAAEEPPDAWAGGSPRPPLVREAVLAARDELLALAERLRQPGEISPQAVALTALLVWDSASPIYTARADATVAQWAGTALDSLTTHLF